tara:strand:- start:1343 stop:1942 length:600 start_codon:yes stop_codon:yes gene_type:complete
MARLPAGQRRVQILETLALALETEAGNRITTAELAAKVGVSEAALYRHFSSKADMFSALIEFAEESVFGLCAQITREASPMGHRCRRVVAMVLQFAARNPGICRVLIGEALVGESATLRARAAQFFARLEAELRKLIREAELQPGVRAAASATQIANLLTALVEGRISRFVRTRFAESPVDEWEVQWRVIEPALFGAAP